MPRDCDFKVSEVGAQFLAQNLKKRKIAWGCCFMPVRFIGTSRFGTMETAGVTGLVLLTSFRRVDRKCAAAKSTSATKPLGDWLRVAMPNLVKAIDNRFVMFASLHNNQHRLWHNQREGLAAAGDFWLRWKLENRPDRIWSFVRFPTVGSHQQR